MKHPLQTLNLATVVCLLCPLPAWASEGEHTDPVAPILLGLAILFLSAKAGGLLARKLQQPAVLGELVFGTLLGNLALVGFNGLDFIHHNHIFEIMAGLGVVFLLFEVGLESSISELMRLGFVSTVVATIGVVFPFIFGYGAGHFLLPEKSNYVHIFLGATLCATSVGITARVLKDLRKTHTREAKIILGAAVIDDVLGLIILAVVSGLISSVSTTGEAAISLGDIALIATKAIGFLGLSLLIGSKIAPPLFRLAGRLQLEGMHLTLSLSFCFLLAYLASLVGLAPIVGAFAAGLILDSTGNDRYFGADEPSLENLIFPLSKFFVPIFFVHMGMQVDLRTFADSHVILLGLALTFMAILGKQACGLGVFGQGHQPTDRLLIGLGMIPRGEVGLIFAAIGANLSLAGAPIIDPPLYSAIVMMVMLTTMLTPPALKWRLSRAPKD